MALLKLVGKKTVFAADLDFVFGVVQIVQKKKVLLKRVKSVLHQTAINLMLPNPKIILLLVFQK